MKTQTKARTLQYHTDLDAPFFCSGEVPPVHFLLVLVMRHLHIQAANLLANSLTGCDYFLLLKQIS